MPLLTSLRAAARMVHNHPALVGWYLRNKLRIAGLSREQRHPSGLSRRPVGITLKPTLSCNLRCSMCSFVTSGAVLANPRDSLRLEVWKQVVDDVRDWRPYFWFTGGEPTLYPDFVPLVAYIKEQGLLAGLTTNGTTLRQKAEALMERPPDMMVVSIDGKGDVHNTVRGSNVAYERATEGVRMVQEIKRRRRLHSPAIIINCALTPDNYERAPEMVEVANELGAEALNYQHLWQFTSAMVEAHNARWGDAHPVSYEECGGMEPRPMDPARVIEVVKEIRRAPTRVPVLFHPELTDDETRTYYEEPETFVRRRPAACAWLNTDILPNGDVSPCFDVVCGNITRERFRDIWNGPAFAAHRQRLQADGDFPICARCCAYWRRD